MGLFGFGKRMEEETKGCHIKVLGAGCKSCHEQHENVKKAKKILYNIDFLVNWL